MDKSIVRVLFLISLTVSCIITVHRAIASSNEWVEKAPMPTTRCYFGAATVNGTIYAIGGITCIPDRKSGHTTTTTNVNEAYDPTTNVWSEKAPMPSPHWLDSYGIAVYENRIYCIGGPANNVYDPATDTWETKTPMPTPRHHLAANIIDGKIYLIGGLALGLATWQGNWADPNFRLITYSRSNLTEVYDPSTDSWIEKTPIPTAVNAYSSVVIDNKIYVISGRTGNDLTALVQVYDPQSDEWSQAAPIPTPVENAAAGVITIDKSEVICVVGGYVSHEGYNGTNLNQVYFPENDSWTMGAPLIANRFALSVAVTNNSLYAIGGMGNCEYTATTYQFSPVDPAETNLTTASPESSSSNETQNNSIVTPEFLIAVTLLLGTVTVSAITIQWKRKKIKTHQT